MAEMKDSGTTWLGKIPKAWELSKISSIYELRTQKVSDRDYPPLSVTMNGVVPQLDSAAKTNAHDDRKLVRKGDFAINSRSDRRGSCGVSEYDGSVSLINTVMKPRDEMNPDYYNWLFHTIQFADEFYKWGHGIVDDLWTTNWQDMKHIDIPVPSLPEQKKIADYLNKIVPEIDSLHTDIEKQIETLEEYKKSVITEAVTKGLNPDVEMKDSGIEWMGMVPSTWESNKVLNCIDFIGGSQPPLSYFEGEEKEGYVRLIQNRDYKTDDYMTFVPKRMVTKFCEVDDVMIGRYGPPLFVLHRGLKGAYNVAIMKAVPKLLDREFMAFYLQNYTLLQYIESFSKRTAGQAGVNTDILKKYSIYVPPMEEQKEIAIYLEKKCIEIDNVIGKKKEQLETLDQYNKSLVYEYVTGKKEVPDA